MGTQPTNIALAGEDRLEIQWSDGQRREYTFVELRRNCPCATCREKRKKPPEPPMALPVLAPAEAQPTKVLGMHPVGNYAYAIAFTDGHDTGIFPFSLLRELGHVVS